MTGPEVALRWHLAADDNAWQFRPAIEGRVVAQLQLTTEQGWRLLSNNFDEDSHGEVLTLGDGEIIEALKRTRAIIGTPK